ncbi:hypothetical protein FACS1894202_06640 [Clostridia bacterium]|nr:hypothetical protein FACS1894202_06640 [Clostridia bacterium]
METNKFTLSIIVTNKFGVLTRVSGLFSKRGYNIDSLTVGVMPENSALSRIIMTSGGDAATQEQIIKQLRKLHDVQEVKLI